MPGLRIVAFAGFDRGYGRKIAVDHGYGVVSNEDL